MRETTNFVQQLNVKAPFACCWIGPTANDATVFYVDYGFNSGNDPVLATEAAAKVDALATAVATGQQVTVFYGDSDTYITGVILRAGTAPTPPLDPRYVQVGDFAQFDPRYRPRTDFTLDDPHNDGRYVRLGDFTAFDPRYVRVNDFTAFDPRYRPRTDFTLDDPHNDGRYVRLGDFAAFDPRYLPANTTHDALPGALAPRHHIVLHNAIQVNVPAAGVVNVTPAALGFPANTLTRNPVAVRVSAWTGTPTSQTSLLMANVGLLGTAWPVRVFDPTGAFVTGSAVIELAARLDP